MRRRSLLVLVLTVVAWCFTTGCYSTPLLADCHKPGAAIVTRAKTGALGVAKVAEGRPDGAEASIGLGFLTFIPLVPFGPQNWTPERILRGYAFREDVAAATVKDLAASGLFESVDITASMKEQAAPEFVLKLTLTNGAWRRYFTTYGLSVGGVFLWFFGAPVSYGHVELGLDAQLLRENQVVASKSFVREESCIESYYTANWEWPKFEDCFAPIAADLRAWLAAEIERVPSRSLSGTSTGGGSKFPPPQRPAEPREPAASTPVASPRATGDAVRAFCTACGESVAGDGSFCTRCGAKR